MIKKLIGIFIIMLSLIGLSGCGGFVLDESLEIAQIDYELMEDGRTKIIISYTDDTIEDQILYLPKGADGNDGKNGNGIKQITYDQSPDNKNTILHIEFTLDSYQPVDILVPNGVSVSSITPVVDPETGNTNLTINYSDGTKSDPILIPKGEKGDTGVGLESYEIINNPDKSVTLIFKYTDKTEFKVQIPAPLKGEDGKDGNEISAITSFEENGKYFIAFEFRNGGDPQVISFDKPKDASQWLKGNGVPGGDLGNDGDYYFDHSHNTIYNKDLGSWILVVDLDGNKDKYTITFELNDNGGPDAMLPPGYGKLYSLQRGECFATSGFQMPLPQRPGYVFDGWYSVKNPNINNGRFNDLTPVFSNLTLYAKWNLA